MKRRFIIASLGLVCAAVCFAAFQGCQTERFDSGADAVIRQLDLPDEYNQIGIKHNEALEYVFQDMRASAVTRTRSGDTTKLTKEEYREFTAASLLNFCRQDDFLSSNMEICEQAVDLENGVLTRSSGTATFKPEIQVFWNEVCEILKSKSLAKKNPAKLKKDLDKINLKAKNTLSEMDALVVYAATSTCYNSYIYWQDNHKKWFMMLNYPEVLEYYTDEEINEAKFYDPTTRGWWKDFWSGAGDFVSEIGDSISDWWDNGGSDVAKKDAIGAGVGAAIAAGSSGGAAAANGAIMGGAGASLEEALEQWFGI